MNLNLTIIKSNKGKDLLNVNNYLFECEKKYVNSENTQVFYWKCSSYWQTQCSARAQTKLINQSHQIMKISEEVDHNHLGSSSSIEVKKLSATVKGQSKISGEKPSIIVQTAITSVPVVAHPYIPSESALKQKVILSS